MSAGNEVGLPSYTLHAEPGRDRLETVRHDLDDVRNPTSVMNRRPDGYAVASWV